MGLRDVGRRQAGVCGESDEQAFVGHDMIEHAGEKAGRRRGGADVMSFEPRQGEESRELVRIGYQIAKCLNGNGFGALAGRFRGHVSARVFAFPKGISLTVDIKSAGGFRLRIVRDSALRGRIWIPHMGKTVLIVEDNELNMKLFHDLLEAHGYGTVGTRNGIEALDLARRHRPDLILMDIQLPEVSGLEVTKWLKDDPELRAIPVVAVTAFAMKGDEERIREGGCEAYLSKPISVAKFIDTVRQFLGNGEAVQ